MRVQNFWKCLIEKLFTSLGAQSSGGNSVLFFAGRCWKCNKNLQLAGWLADGKSLEGDWKSSENQTAHESKIFQPTEDGVVSQGYPPADGCGRKVFFSHSKDKEEKEMAERELEMIILHHFRW